MKQIMKSHIKRAYTPPTSNICQFVADEFCIGFGEGSIPPEDSESNMGWFDEELSNDGLLPKLSLRLWDE